MRSAGTYPHRIVTGSVNALTIMQGSTRAWSYDEGGGAPVYQTDLGVTSAFTRWVNNRGQGTHKVAFRFGQSAVGFGGVTWNQAFNVGGNNAAWGAANGLWVDFANPGVAYVRNNFGGALPAGQGVDALASFCWADSSGYLVSVGGLTVGRSYCFQIVVADSRGPGVDDRKVDVVPIVGMGGVNTSGQQRFAYGTDVRYTVVSVRFIATSDVVRFRPDVYNSDGTYAGPQINALNILENVLPQGKMFYVANDGNDNNDGMSRDTPWASIGRVHERTYGPGDCILFKRGHKWTGQLFPQGSGASGQPIVLSAYGEGAQPLIDANGAYAAAYQPGGSAIQLSGSSHWIIDGFECTNWPAGATYGSNIAHRSGILINNGGNDVTIRNCYVHDVMSATDVDNYGRYGGGIMVVGGLRDGVLIENNVIDNILGIGVLVHEEMGDAYAAWLSNMWTNVVVRGNRVHNTSVDGILVMNSDAPLIEFNHSSFAAMSGRFSARNSVGGMWVQYARAAVFQYNHCHDTKTWVGVINTPEGYDGQALGIDYNMAEQSVMRYNFIHDCPFGSFGDYGAGAYNSNASLAVHYNISIDSGRLSASRSESHFGNIYYSSTEPLLLHWGGPFSFTKNIVVAPSMTGTATASDNLWYPMAKPSGDATGQSSDPLFSSAPPALLFSDMMVCYPAGNDFNVNTGPDGGQQQEPRWRGTLKSLNPKYLAYGAAGAFRMGGEGNINDYRVMKTNASVSGFIALNTVGFNFENKPITVRMVVRSIAGTTAENWLALCVSGSDFTSAASPLYILRPATDYGILFRAGGHGIQSFKRGSATATARAWAGSRGPTYAHLIELVVTGADGTSGPFSGATRVRVYSDGLLIDDQTLTNPLANFKVGIEQISSDWRIAGFEVFYGLPADRFRAYEGLLAAGPIAPATSTAAPAGATDFFRNALPTNPKRGAITATSLVGYVQTPTRIEIRGRYRIARPGNGSLDFNYDAIIRDQNHRVVAAAPTWSVSPALPGVSVAATTGVVTVDSTAVAGNRFAIKAAIGSISHTFPVEVV